jgi:5-methylcytosine-specific restriction endonuclease McrA
VTHRKKLFRYQRAIVFLAANGKCYICGEPIREKIWHCEHVIPLWKGGADDADNMRPAHVLCHKPKSRREAAERAKEKRRGKPKKPSRAIPGSRRSGLKVRLTSKGPRVELRKHKPPEP